MPDTPGPSRSQLETAAHEFTAANARLHSTETDLAAARESAVASRAVLAEALRNAAKTRLGTVNRLVLDVAALMDLSPSTVKGALYEYPHRADVLSTALSVLCPSGLATTTPRPAMAQAA